MNIKTVITTDGVNAVDFGSMASRFYWFRNIGTAAVYVSGNSDITAGGDGVAELAVGDSVCIESLSGKVYVLGASKVQITNQGDKFCPFKLAPVAGGGGVTVCNDNLLINPDFSINQRGVSGTFSETGKYFVDRWKLVSGTVTVNSNRTITLNGSICQIFERDLDTNVTASVSAGTITADVVTVNTGEAYVYSVTISAEGETISWAKLEIGSTATPFLPPEPATELIKCQRYYQVHNLARQRIWYYTADMLAFFLPNKVLMRSGCTATINGTLAIIALDNRNQSGFNFVIEWAIADGVKVCAKKTDHGLTDAILYVNGLPSSGQIEIDAEIY